MTQKWISYHPEDTAHWLIEQCTQSKILLFIGDLGAGKTTTITYLCRLLGVTTEISSPTYSIINEYVTNSGRVFHMDLYRLNSLDEALEIGLDDYFYTDEYCLIEWPQVYMDHIEVPYYFIEIDTIDTATRAISLNYIEP
jgi:tRNA threonylcarbamoyladenosine biosynthesis protein TsaE